MMPAEFIAQQEVVIKEETNFWKLKKREEQGYILKAGGTQVAIPFEGITALPNYLKTQTGRTRQFSRTYGRDQQTANQEQNQKKRKSSSCNKNSRLHRGR